MTPCSSPVDSPNSPHPLPLWCGTQTLLVLTERWAWLWTVDWFFLPSWQQQVKYTPAPSQILSHSRVCRALTYLWMMTSVRWLYDRPTWLHCVLIACRWGGIASHHWVRGWTRDTANQTSRRNTHFGVLHHWKVRKPWPLNPDPSLQRSKSMHYLSSFSPPAMITWSKNSSPLGSGGRVSTHQGGRQLVITSLESQDAGTYMCTAGTTNSPTLALSASATVQIIGQHASPQHNLIPWKCAVVSLWYIADVILNVHRCMHMIWNTASSAVAQIAVSSNRVILRCVGWKQCLDKTHSLGRWLHTTKSTYTC